MIYDAIIIGAGASGMFAAITAAENNARVCLIESEDRIGKKLLATGNGKCNLTNMNITEDCYRTSSQKKIMSIISRFNNDDVVYSFKQMGLLTRQREGYVYPYNEQALVVLDILRFRLNELKVDIFVKSKITKYEFKNNFFNVVIERENDTTRIQGKKLCVSTGSNAGLKKSDSNIGVEIAKYFGHTIIKRLPALVPLMCKENFFKEISGVRAKGNICLFCDDKPLISEKGEIQFTDYGISGIPVFQISRYAVKALEYNKKSVVKAYIDFMPEYTREELGKFLKEYIEKNHSLISQNKENIFVGLINKKIMALIVRLTGNDIEKIVEKIKKFAVTIIGAKGIENAQVTQGGVSLDEINTDTFESDIQPGLYFCGEIIDVDGICGGYNLQWAWTSGHLAGLHLLGGKNDKN